MDFSVYRLRDVQKTLNFFKLRVQVKTCSKKFSVSLFT